MGALADAFAEAQARGTALMPVRVSRAAAGDGRHRLEEGHAMENATDAKRGGAAHAAAGDDVSLVDLQTIIFGQMRALAAVDPKDAAAVQGACAVAEAVRGLAGVAVDNANTALRARALARDMRLAGVMDAAAHAPARNMLEG